MSCEKFTQSLAYLRCSIAENTNDRETELLMITQMRTNSQLFQKMLAIHEEHSHFFLQSSKTTNSFLAQRGSHSFKMSQKNGQHFAVRNYTFELIRKNIIVLAVFLVHAIYYSSKLQNVVSFILSLRSKGREASQSSESDYKSFFWALSNLLLRSE